MGYWLLRVGEGGEWVFFEWMSRTTHHVVTESDVFVAANV